MAGRKKKKKAEDEALLAPDAFLENAGQGAGWFEKNFKVVLGGVAAALIAVFAIQTMSASKARAAAEVTTDLNDAVEAYREATDLQTVLTSTAPESLKTSFKKVHDQLADLRTAHPEGGPAIVAALYQADLARRLEKYDDAVALYDIYLKGSPADDSLRFFALEGVGYALEAADKPDEALERFKTLESTQDFYKDYALKHQARILESKGDKAAAATAYKAIVDMDPESPLKSFAQSRLKAVQ